MVPVVTGPGGLKPKFGIRTQVIACRAVHPCLAPSGSAPWSTRNTPSSQWALVAASTTVFMPSGSRSSGSAPAAMSRRAASIWPARTANSSGVKPCGAGPSSPVRRGTSGTTVRAWTSAPASMRASRVSMWPSAAAHIRGVWPDRWAALTSAPWATRARTASARLARAAVRRGGLPAGPRGIRVGAGLQQRYRASPPSR